MKNQAPVLAKEPYLAFILSMVFPGTGQIYAGKVLRGITFTFISILLFGLGGWLITSPEGSFSLGIQLLIALFIVFLFNLFDARNCARRANSRDFEKIRKSDKDPWLAVLLSSIIPGLGHAAQGQWIFAILFFVFIIVFGSISVILPVFALLAMGLAYYCIYHAYIYSPTRRAKSQRLILIVCLLLFLSELMSQVFLDSLLEIRYIPSGAMAPTLQIDDRIVINKFLYHFNQPERGDVIIFRPTDVLRQDNPELKDAFVMRIIGIPDDVVEIKNGRVFINSELIEENYIAEPPQYEWGPEQVPADSYFVLGDNRNNSYDSHYWGFVPRDHIIGRATKRCWPPSRTGAIE